MPASLVTQTDLLDLGRGTGTGLVVAAEPGDSDLPRIATVRCTENGTTVEPPADGPGTGGATGREAVDAWVAKYAPDGTLALSDGYRDDPYRWYLLDSADQRAVLEVWGTDQGEFEAFLGEMC